LITFFALSGSIVDYILQIDEESLVYGFHFAEKCKSDLKRLKYAKEYQAEHPEERILFSKAFLIDQDAADRIRVYTEKCHPSYRVTRRRSGSDI
jgi:aminopeptidase-like protein